MSWLGKFGDYLHGLNHEADNFDPVPEELQSKIRDFSENTFIRDILRYLGSKDPVYYKYPVQLVEIRDFEYEYGILKGCISKEERYDSWKICLVYQMRDFAKSKEEDWLDLQLESARPSTNWNMQIHLAKSCKDILLLRSIRTLKI